MGLSQHATFADVAIPNADFAKTAVSADGTTQPVDWKVGAWGGLSELEGRKACGIVSEEEGKKDSKSVYLDLKAKGTVGWVSALVPVSSAKDGFELKVAEKYRGDLKGSIARVFVTWFKGAAYLGKSEKGSALAGGEGVWQTIALRIEPKDIPAGATDFRVNLALQGEGESNGRLFYSGLQLSGPSQNTVQLPMHGDKPFHCWNLGEVICFKTTQGELGPEIESITGVVTDFSGNQVAEIVTNRDKFLQDGWQWKPDQPGYYEVVFSIKKKGERQRQVVLQTFSKAHRPSPKAEVVMIPFERDRFSLAVMARPVRTRDEKLAQFGFVALIGGTSKTEEDAPIADWLGMGFARIHGIFWGGHWTPETSALEPARGVFKWDRLDGDLAPLRKYGFTLVGNIFNTPQWASPHPELTDLHICVRGFEGYAPKDMNDWTNFLRKLVERYGSEIKVWEIWNEPHLPGGSVFWNDSPENFVAMLKAAYQTIKSVQPDSEIWIGGMAHRYLPFYKAILALGAAPYFDRLAIHGSMQGPEGFRRLDKEAGVASKPWVESEWHGILFGTSDLARTKKLPSEAELGRQLILDLLYQLKFGVERTALFQMVNKTEIEVLLKAEQYKWYALSAGLFRKNPWIEPRLPAVVLRTFFDQIDKKVVYRGEYNLADGQKAVLLETGGKKLVCFWSTASKAEPICAELKSAILPATRIINWVGTPVASAGLTLDPNAVYWMTGADTEGLEKSPSASNVLLSMDGRQRQEYKGPAGLAQEHSLFAAITDPLPESSQIEWNSEQWVQKETGKSSNAKTATAKFAIGYESTNGFDLIVEVKGDGKGPGPFWKGNGIQFALGTDGSGLIGEQVQFRVTETEKGVVFTKESAPYIGGDLPARWTPAGEAVRHGGAAVEHLPDGTSIYKIRLDWGEFYPLVRDKKEALHFSVLANLKETSDSRVWLEWGSGIAGIKNPALYGSIRPSEEKMEGAELPPQK